MMKIFKWNVNGGRGNISNMLIAKYGKDLLSNLSISSDNTKACSIRTISTSNIINNKDKGLLDQNTLSEGGGKHDNSDNIHNNMNTVNIVNIVNPVNTSPSDGDVLNYLSECTENNDNLSLTLKDDKGMMKLSDIKLSNDKGRNKGGKAKGLDKGIDKSQRAIKKGQVAEQRATEKALSKVRGGYTTYYLNYICFDYM